MTLPLLNLPPGEGGYAVQPDADTLMAKMGAGPSRFRRDQVGAVSTVSVQWRCSRLQFDYVMAFFRTTVPGSMPFRCELIIDSADPAEFEARLIPGSLRVSGVQGTLRVVDAELEVRPDAGNAETDAALVMLYELYGDEADDVLLALSELATVTMPDTLV